MYWSERMLGARPRSRRAAKLPEGARLRSKLKRCPRQAKACLQTAYPSHKKRRPFLVSLWMGKLSASRRYDLGTFAAVKPWRVGRELAV